MYIIHHALERMDFGIRHAEASPRNGLTSRASTKIVHVLLFRRSVHQAADECRSCDPHGLEQPADSQSWIFALASDSDNLTVDAFMKAGVSTVISKDRLKDTYSAIKRTCRRKAGLSHGPRHAS